VGNPLEDLAAVSSKPTYRLPRPVRSHPSIAAIAVIVIGGIAILAAAIFLYNKKVADDRQQAEAQFDRDVQHQIEVLKADAEQKRQELATATQLAAAHNKSSNVDASVQKKVTDLEKKLQEMQYKLQATQAKTNTPAAPTAPIGPANPPTAVFSD